MNQIRVNSGITVEVNDNGDTILVNAEDQYFIEKFLGLNEKLENIANTDAKELENKSEREQLEFVILKTKEIMAEIDGLFGEDACRKVFGNIIPSPYLIADFFDQLTPIAEQYMDERQKKISKKYNRNRKGSNKYRSKEELIRDAMRE